MNKTRIIEQLHDQQSRILIEQHQKMLETGTYVSFFSHQKGNMNRFSHSALSLGENEKIISINPMQGGALKQFCSLTNKSCLIHYFEESPLLYMDVCKHIIAWELENNIVPVCSAITKYSGMYALNHNGGSGHYTSGELVAIDAIKREQISQAVYGYSLDDYIEKSDFKPTLIECGRPGAANSIIQGALKTITQHKPKLMIVDSPFSELPLLLRQLVREYKVYYCEYGLRNVGVFYATAQDEGLSYE